MKTKISIITCCKNSLPYLKDNINSVKKQSFKNFDFNQNKTTARNIIFLRKDLRDLLPNPTRGEDARFAMHRPGCA
jgi:glycosyltransferase involved in cell wall biosynthesis